MSRRVELLPDEYLARPIYTKRIKQWMLITIALSGLVCFFAYFQRKDVARLEREIVPIRQSIAEFKGTGDRFALLAEELEIAAAQQSVADRLQKTSDWSLLLKDLCDTTHGELWFVELSIHEKDSGTNDEDAGRSRIRIKGMAPSNAEISQFMRRLSVSKHFRELSLESSHEPRSQDGSVKVEFEISGIAL